MDFSGQKYGNVVPCFSLFEKVAHFRSLRGEKAHQSLCTDFYRLLLSLPLWSYLVSFPCNKLWWWVQPYAEPCVFLAKNRTCGWSWGSLKQALEYTYAHSETKSSISHFTHIYRGPAPERKTPCTSTKCETKRTYHDQSILPQQERNSSPWGLSNHWWISASPQFSPWLQPNNKHIYCALQFTTNCIWIFLVNLHKTPVRKVYNIIDEETEDQRKEISVLIRVTLLHIQRMWMSGNQAQFFKSLVTAFFASSSLKCI